MFPRPPRTGYRQGLGTPAAADPQKIVREDGSNAFVPGSKMSNASSKPKRKKLEAHLEDAFFTSESDGMDIARRLAANALGVEVDDIPRELDTPASLSAWVHSILSCAGSIDHSREVWDRMSPKPRRVELTGAGGGPVRQIISRSDKPGEQAAAQDYYDQLEGAVASEAVASDEPTEDELLS